MRILSKSPLLIAALFALTLHPRAQTTTYRIAGHIVSAIDQRPLQRATVQLLTPGENKLIATTTSAEDGAFVFTELKAGAYVLEGSTRNYISSKYDEHGGYNTAIITGAAGVDTESLVLKLSPGADISGRVTDQSGDPLRRANVTLYRESHENGSATTQRVAGTVTDDTGAYDLPHLAPDTYFLSATTTPWYAVHPQLEQVASQPGVVASLDPALDVAFAETFYPEVTDPSAATPIVLLGGEQSDIDIRLTAQTALTITIPHADSVALPTPPTTGDRAALVEYQRVVQQQLRTRAQGQPQFQIYKEGFDGLEQIGAEMRGSLTATEFVGLPPGHYVVRQIDPRPAGVTKSINVNLTEQNAQVEPERGETLGDVKVVLKMADGAKFETPASFALIGKGPTQPRRQQMSDKGEGEAKAIEPGDYRLHAFFSGRQAMVFNVTADGKPLAGNLVHVAAGTTTSITATVSRGEARLEGFAKDSDKPAPGAMILLLPADPAYRSGYTWRDQSDLDGSFHLTNIPAGHYVLLAIQNGWDLDWRNDATLARYLPLATQVVIPESAATIKLPDSVPLQGR